MKKIFPLVLLTVLVFSGCVSKKLYKAQQANQDALELENEALYEKLDSLVEDLAAMEVENEQLKQDTSVCGKTLKKERQRYDDLQAMYDDLVAENKTLLKSSSKEIKDLKKKLEKQRSDLQAQEDSLFAKEMEIDQLLADLKKREEKVQELQDLLNSKDAAIADLKTRIENALLNFGSDELSVEVRDGKIYVSLAQKLLFKSGSTYVEKKGQDALKQLAKVLEKESDFDILIEGHTDTDPINTGCIKDNWDLSVMRATSIVRILVDEGNINPKRVVPSGRGEHVPVASNDTAEGKAKNRRTEIILSPKLDKIFEILNN